MGRVKENFQLFNLDDRAYDGRLGGDVCFVWEDYSLEMVGNILGWS